MSNSADVSRSLAQPGTSWAEREAEAAPWQPALAEFVSTVNIARSYLSRRHPFFGRLLLYCEVVATDRTRDVAVRTDSVIFVNPLWFTRSLDTYERAGSLAFASLYLALTCSERGARKPALPWAVATSTAIASLVDRCGLTLPMSLRKLLQEAAALGWLELSDEEIYLRLVRGGGRPAMMSTMGEGWGLHARQGPGVRMVNGTLSDAAALAMAGASWGGRLRLALDARKGVGTMPGDLVDRIEGTAPHSIPWEQLLARAVRGEVSKMRRTGMPNQRKLWPFAGLMPAPRVIYPSYKPSTPRVDVAIDTSGSMMGDEIALAVGVIGDLLRYLRVPTRVIQCDAKVHDVSRVRAVESLSIVGGGGTSPDPVFDMLREERRPPGVLIYVTDMYMHFDSLVANPPRFPVIWVDVCGWSTETPPVGHVVRAKGK